MNVLFLCSLYSQSQIDIYRENSKCGLQFAAQNLQESIIEGAIANDISITVLSQPILSTYPLGYKKIKVQDSDFIFRGINIGKSLGFCNLPFLNIPPISTLMRYIKEWYNSHVGEKVLWVYSLNPLLMKAAIDAKSHYHDIEIKLIVPDLIRFCGFNKYYKYLGLQKRRINKVNKLSKQFDKYVLLCENMAIDLGITRKKYVVMEGIFSPENVDEVVQKKSNKTILYTGNLDSRYGVIDLINAFELIQDDNYRLMIRGNGSTESIIKEYISKDNRISLIPPLSKADLIRLEMSATLLVNPVSPTQDFTNYFFPSKTMDYLASGTPTIMFPLTCIPKEYKKHLYFFTGDTPEDMANDMVRLCETRADILETRGKEAAKFIHQNKLSKQQVKKIIDL